MEKVKKIEAPCKVGDIIYRKYPLEETITKWVVVNMFLASNGWTISMRNCDTNKHKTFFERDVWRWFFDSKEEAEKRFAELYNKNND